MRRQKLDPIAANMMVAFPLFFWRTCDACKLEWRREWGWLTRVGAPERRAFYAYRLIELCHACAPTREDALRVARELAEAVPVLRPSAPAPALSTSDAGTLKFEAAAITAEQMRDGLESPAGREAIAKIVAQVSASDHRRDRP